jgi:hypothetical protein
MDTSQKTESLSQLVSDIDKGAVALPEFQRDFVWEVEKTYDLFDSFVKDIFVGSLIYGSPSFEITVREIDKRPKTGKGSRVKPKLTSHDRAEIDRMVKTNGFRLLLDGQQRATSVYRALQGIDPVYYVAKSEDELPDEVKAIPIAKRSVEQVLSEFSGSPQQGRVCVSLKHVYEALCGEHRRDKEKVPLFMASCVFPELTPDQVEHSNHFEAYLTQLRNLENLFRQEKLVAYYLLDTNEEKFALFFERSNSMGQQLNFIDILAAKLYAGFNLRQHIEDFETTHPGVKLNKEVLVRFISFVISGGKDTGRAYILGTLNHAHFTEHWPAATTLYTTAYEYLRVNRLLIHPGWMPYDNLLIPLMAFLRQIPRYEFSQISERQGRAIRTWYWLSILSRRYSSAAQTYVLDDAKALELAGQGDFSSLPSLLSKMSLEAATADNLLSIYKKYDALYKGVLNLVNYDSGGFTSWQSGEPVSWMTGNLEDHHIFPKDYLAKHAIKTADDTLTPVLIDCVVNRTLIPKLTNIKVSNKPPSKYLGEIRGENGKLEHALDRHLIPRELESGEYDDLYALFLDDRAKLFLAAIKTHVVEARVALLSEIAADAL